MTRSQLNIDHVARVEGHGNVHVVIEDDVVKTVEMNIVEPARLFESMVRGQSYKDCSYISSRICGICSPSHCVTDLKAVEDAFGIEVSPRTKMLRELLVYGSYLQNHASHLFVFVVPDFVGEDERQQVGWCHVAVDDDDLRALVPQIARILDAAKRPILYVHVQAARYFKWIRRAAFFDD